jgi:GntR family transcriptional regulator
VLPSRLRSTWGIYSDLVPEIDPDSPELAYVQVANDLARRITSGKLHGRLPAERDLAVDYGVAYQTVRRAMEVLRERGLIRTVHGRGTFATPEGEHPE